MMTDHDQDILPRCRRLGQEVTFGYCRQETAGKPCRLILNCWWETFDVRGFLRANLPEDTMAQVERAHLSPPPSKVLSLLELVQQAKERLAGGQDSSHPPKPET